ncbi:MAG: hypothetical protein CNLJKLNK_00181 [Holosporales bacterium]
MLKFILFLCVGFLNFLDAQIPAVAFKEVTKYFKNPHYSPLMGRVALDSGYIYNLRHFGLFIPAVGKNPDGTERRLYDSDTPNDDMMALLITLFPSSAGQLASESMAVSNFGKNAKVEDVAKILQFAKAVRAAISQSSHLQNDPESTWGLTKILDQYKDLGKMRSLIVQSIRLEYNADNKKRDGQRAMKQKNYKMLKQDYARPMDDEAIERTAIAQSERTQRIILKNQEDKDRRKISNDENSLYPLYTTEQIILAFFVHKFNEKEDIYTLMKILGDDFVTPFRESEIWNLGDISSYEDTSDLDYIFITTHHDLNAPIPFKKGNNPISNGSCPKINIVNGKKEITYGTFADCHETALRQLCSIGFYDAPTKTFKIPEPISNPYLRYFFLEEPPHKANDGSSQMRGKWNLVIGGLPDVRYRQGINEIDAGYINLIKAMRLVLNIENDTLPKNQYEAIAALKDIFKTMNPLLKDIQINIANFSSRRDGYKGMDNDFYGDATITITNAYNQTFSFVLRQFQGHADIRNPTWNDTNTPLPKLIEREDPILSLVDRRDIKTGIHQLLAVQEFADERQRIDRVKDFSQIESNLKQQYIPIIDRMMDLKVDDTENMRNAKEAITPLIQKGFMFTSAADIALSRYSDENFFNLCFNAGKDIVIQRIKEKGTVYLTSNILSKIRENIPDYLKYLKNIDVEDAYVELNLHDATNLERIKINYSAEIGTLTLPNSPSLKMIDLRGNITSEHLDLSQATYLETIIMRDKANIGTLTLPNSPSLKMIDLGGNITTEHLDLSQATNLEEIYTGHYTKINTLTLPNSPSLKKIDLGGNITIEDLDLRQYTNLEKIEMGHDTNIPTLTLPNSPSLKSITLNGPITIEDLDLSQATNLELIIIGNKANIPTLTLPNSPSLKSITLNGPITTANLDLRQYTNLENINIDYNANIPTLTLPNLPSLKNIFLKAPITTEELDLSQVTNLEEILIGYNANIGTLTLPNSPSLKNITLGGTIKQITAYRHQESNLKYKKWDTTVRYLDADTVN